MAVKNPSPIRLVVELVKLAGLIARRSWKGITLSLVAVALLAEAAAVGVAGLLRTPSDDIPHPTPSASPSRNVEPSHSTSPSVASPTATPSDEYQPTLPPSDANSKLPDFRTPGALSGGTPTVDASGNRGWELSGNQSLQQTTASPVVPPADIKDGALQLSALFTVEHMPVGGSMTIALTPETQEKFVTEGTGAPRLVATLSVRIERDGQGYLIRTTDGKSSTRLTQLRTQNFTVTWAANEAVFSGFAYPSIPLTDKAFIPNVPVRLSVAVTTPAGAESTEVVFSASSVYRVVDGATASKADYSITGMPPIPAFATTESGLPRQSQSPNSYVPSLF